MKQQSRGLSQSIGIRRVAFLSWIILIVILAHFSTPAHSTEVTLAWDPNTELDLAGYKIYYGFETGNYVYSIDVGNMTSYAVTGLEENRTIYFAATAYDEENESDYSEEVVFIAENQPPVADAGPDQTVDEGTVVTLSAANSHDPDDGIASYNWTQLDGTSVALSDSGAVEPTFNSPNTGLDGDSLTFSLTVSDHGGLQSNDTCIVNVTWVNQPPVADAGPDQKAFFGQTIALDGSGSTDADGGVVSYLWRQTSGGPVTLSEPTSATAEFVAPAQGRIYSKLTFELTVTDSGGLKAADSCTVKLLNSRVWRGWRWWRWRGKSPDNEAIRLVDAGVEDGMVSISRTPGIGESKEENPPPAPPTGLRIINR